MTLYSNSSGSGPGMYTGYNYDVVFQQLWKWARHVQAPQPAPPALLAPSVTRKRRRAFVTMRTTSRLRGPRAVSSMDKLKRTGCTMNLLWKALCSFHSASPRSLKGWETKQDDMIKHYRYSLKPLTKQTNIQTYTPNITLGYEQSVGLNRVIGLQLDTRWCWKVSQVGEDNSRAEDSDSEEYSWLEQSLFELGLLEFCTFHVLDKRRRRRSKRRCYVFVSS